MKVAWDIFVGLVSIFLLVAYSYEWGGGTIDTFGYFILGASVFNLLIRIISYALRKR